MTFQLWFHPNDAVRPSECFLTRDGVDVDSKYHSMGVGEDQIITVDDVSGDTTTITRSA